MSVTTTLPSEAIKRKIRELNEQRESYRQQKEDAHRNYLSVIKEIFDMQAQCPHTEATQELIDDCAEMKLRWVCKACGAICQKPSQ